MGVKNLWDILESCKKTLPLHHLQNKRVCIDLSCWMVQLQSVNKSYCALKDKVYLRGLFHRLRALIALNCSLIFVTDGSIPAIKLSTYRRRLNSGTEAMQDETNSNNVTSLRRNKGSEFSCMIKEAKLLGVALGIPCLDGVEEAEAQCALLNSESLCDGCFTSDSDIFLFGARTVYRDICLGDGHVVCYEMDDIERKLGFGRNSLIALAVLLGSDYSPGVHGFGPESACRIVKLVGDNAVLQQIASEGLSIAMKLKGSRKEGHNIRCRYKKNGLDPEMNINGSQHDLPGEDHFLQVIDAYVKPKCHSADSGAVHRVLALLPFQRTKLQEICAQIFEWPPEITDEYILPKIAERDLRRFANLRYTASNLGVSIPLDQMPVKCPVSGIVKKRKVHRKECFEVSWEEMHGLNTSIVPADLIERACPEKIMEFEERRTQCKKPNHCKPRPKKSVNRAPIEDIDPKLRDLLLDIELESRVSRKTLFSRDDAVSKTRNDEPIVDSMNQNLDSNERDSATDCYPTGSNVAATEPILDQIYRNLDSNGNVDRYSFSNCYPAGSNVAATEVIDLLSPSPLVSKCQQAKVESVTMMIDSSPSPPPAHSRIVSYCQHAKVECVSMIDLSPSPPPAHGRVVSNCQLASVDCIDMVDVSESEIEESPEHVKKARELRLFLDSIREDLS